MFARNNNRSNEREIKTNFVLKLNKLNFYINFSINLYEFPVRNKLNFYINFSINLYEFPVRSTVKYCDVEL